MSLLDSLVEVCARLYQSENAEKSIQAANDIASYFRKVRKLEDAYRHSDNLVRSLASTEYECEIYADENDYYDADTEEK